MLPNTLIIGGERCGTTWLYDCLREHPQIFFSLTKEIDFFSRNYDKNIKYYEAFFTGAEDGDYRIIGEKSTDYLAYELCPQRIAKHIPKVALIAILRNPIDRALSHYLAFMQANSNLEFKDAIIKNPGLLESGCYYKHLERYYHYFNRDQVLVMLFDDIKENPLKFIRNVYAFLKVDEMFSPPSLEKKVNIAAYPGLKKILYNNKMRWLIILLRKTILDNLIRQLAYWRKTRNNSSISDETRERLVDYFREANKKLSLLINRDLSHWN